MKKTIKKSAKKTVKKTAKKPAAKASSRSPLKVGNTVLIRTVTYHHIGTVVEAGADYVFLEPAVWLANSGRFNKALKTGSLEEAEPFEDGVEVARTAIVDSTVWKHAIPNEPI